MKNRIEPWLQPHLDRRLRDPVGYRPNTRTPPDFFGIGTPFTGGGK